MNEAKSQLRAKLKEAEAAREQLQKQIDTLTAAIPDLEDRKAKGLNAALACCGCGRGLKDNGSLTVYSVLKSLHEDTGLLDFSKLKELKGFVSTVEADEFALANGWQVKDSIGPNHRCPECVKKQIEKGPSKQRGAYIDLRTASVAASPTEALP